MTDDERQAIDLRNRIVTLEKERTTDAARLKALEDKINNWIRNAVLAIGASVLWLFQDTLEKIRDFFR